MSARRKRTTAATALQKVAVRRLNVVQPPADPQRRATAGRGRRGRVRRRPAAPAAAVRAVQATRTGGRLRARPASRLRRRCVRRRGVEVLAWSQRNVASSRPAARRVVRARSAPAPARPPRRRARPRRACRGCSPRRGSAAREARRAGRRGRRGSGHGATQVLRDRRRRPVRRPGQVIAGVGVSGGTTEQDIAIVEAAME